MAKATVFDDRSKTHFASQADIDAYREFCHDNELDDDDSPSLQLLLLRTDGHSGLAHDLQYLIQATFMLDC